MKTIESVFVRDGLLYVLIDGTRKYIASLRNAGDRLEGYTSTTVTYVSQGNRYIWSVDGSTKFFMG